MDDSITRSNDPGLDEVVRELNAICRNATFDLVFRVGEFVIERVFGSDEAIWQQEGTRNISYRRLAARGDLALGASALCRAVSIYVLVERVGGRERWRQLAASHFQEVLPLDFDDQCRLLSAADEQEWSVSRLRAEVRLLKPPAARPPERAAQSLHSLAQRVAVQVRALETTDLERLEAVSADRLRETFESLRREIAVVEAALNRRDSRARSQSDIVELSPLGRVAGKV